MLYDLHLQLHPQHPVLRIGVLADLREEIAGAQRHHACVRRGVSGVRVHVLLQCGGEPGGEARVTGNVPAIWETGGLWDVSYEMGGGG